MRRWIPLCMSLAGMASVIYGAWLIYAPFAYLLGGAWLAAIAYFTAHDNPRSKS